MSNAEYMREYMREYYRKRREQGLCLLCGLPLETDNHKTCDRCRAKMAEHNRDYYRKNKKTILAKRKRNREAAHD